MSGHYGFDLKTGRIGGLSMGWERIRIIPKNYRFCR